MHREHEFSYIIFTYLIFLFKNIKLLFFDMNCKLKKLLSQAGVSNETQTERTARNAHSFENIHLGETEHLPAAQALLPTWETFLKVILAYNILHTIYISVFILLQKFLFTCMSIQKRESKYMYVCVCAKKMCVCKKRVSKYMYVCVSVCVQKRMFVCKKEWACLIKKLLLCVRICVW